MIYIYTPIITSRLQYVFDVCFQDILLTEYTFLTLEEAQQGTLPLINYSKESLANSISITPHHILFEENIYAQNIEVTWENNLPFFFKTATANKFNYDIFAMIFYCISRYEEYLPSILDKHDRFQAEQSLAFMYGFLELPVVHLWLMQLKEGIEKKYAYTFSKQQSFSFLNTIDIDVAYAFKGKGLGLQIGRFLKNSIQKNISALKKQFLYAFRLQKDPFDTYSYILKTAKEKQIETIFFFQMASGTMYDKNLKHTSAMYQDCIKKCVKHAAIGLHPSYFSDGNNVLANEKRILETISGNKITKSRQHFLRLQFPDTYAMLESHGIQKEYSMGYASQVGFRAGICMPYAFFNLKTNTKSKLTVVPFQVMDGVLKDYLKLTPEQAIDKIEKLVAVVKKVNGCFVSVWHNSSLSEIYGWQNWKAVYKKMLAMG